jgi:hypothetical protein
MTDEEWEEFVNEKELAFADACGDALEEVKWKRKKTLKAYHLK